MWKHLLPGTGRPAAHRTLEPIPPSELLENKIATQAAEIDQLVEDNHRLAASHVGLRQEIADAKHEGQKLKVHIKSIQNESDIRMRILLDKIANAEAGMLAGERLKKELQEAHTEACHLARARQEMVARVEQASEELQKTRAEVESIPELHIELDNLRKEHQRLRSTFQYERSLNIERVAQLQAMEKDLIDMASELQNLHAEVLGAQKRTCVNPCGSGCTNPDQAYTPSIDVVNSYDAYRQPIMQMSAGPTSMIPYGSGSSPDGTAVVSHAAIPGAVMGGQYDPLFLRGEQRDAAG